MARAMKWILSFISTYRVLHPVPTVQCLGNAHGGTSHGVYYGLLVLYSLMPLVALELLAFYGME